MDAVLGHRGSAGQRTRAAGTDASGLVGMGAHAEGNGWMGTRRGGSAAGWECGGAVARAPTRKRYSNPWKRVLSIG